MGGCVVIAVENTQISCDVKQIPGKMLDVALIVSYTIGVNGTKANPNPANAATTERMASMNTRAKLTKGNGNPRRAGRPPIGQKRMDDKITLRLDDGMRGMIQAQAGSVGVGEWIRRAIRVRLAVDR